MNNNSIIKVSPKEFFRNSNGDLEIKWVGGSVTFIPRGSYSHITTYPQEVAK